MIDQLQKVILKNYFEKINQSIELNGDLFVAGTVKRISGMKIEATGLSASLGSLCQIFIADNRIVTAEVVGFSGTLTYLMANEDIYGIKPGSKVLPFAHYRRVQVGVQLLGRIIDAEGKPIDDKGPISSDEYYPGVTKPINPLLRNKIDSPLDVGIRAINALFTVGKGQRIGIFAGTGVGKSVLLGMMTRFTKAHIVVVGLIGERGREVKEFIEQNIGEEGLEKTIIVASPADTSPLMRVNGAMLATTIAEYFRDRGFDVLLIVDSLTRFAQAQREIALSVGELPTTKGYTPSVFAKLSQLVERSGNGIGGTGSITAFFTILVEGDDHADPVADHAKSVLDGHINLSREMADSGHYPAIDIEKSISRVMVSIVNPQQMLIANYFKKLYSAYTRNRDLINVGMYQAGSDKTVDEAISLLEEMNKFLVQGTDIFAPLEDSINKLRAIFSHNPYSGGFKS